LELEEGAELKIDIVQDPFKNINKIDHGLHSVEDIYARKIYIPLNPHGLKIAEDGREVSVSRQEAKDVYDLYYLSTHCEPLASFYKNHFSRENLNRIESWYRSLNKAELKETMSNRFGVEDPNAVFRHLDKQVLNALASEMESENNLEGGTER